MQYQIIKKKNYESNTWTHGETTQLKIYPHDGDYKNRDFLWRVSSATVTKELSDFTVLFGIKRWIMPFDHQLHLSHHQNGKPMYSITLNPYESHCFKGDWETKSKGIARDFNLMLNEGAYGILNAAKVSEDGKELGSIFPEAFDERLPLADHKLTLGIYSREGNISLNVSDTMSILLPCEDLLLLDYTLVEVDEIKKYRLKHNGVNSSQVVLFAVTY
ncbi:HutD family protein [Fusibacter bizertensis]|uniref:HutD family protein n=1 Tax=Fusibacter bizertensis TaxID=1488331 RepID=A0ABT6NBA8_9FIRM|nr:HutD family protein [Fusibacter bizertensis]MDH8677705.1 HutD family protein [Fusibacter bizertensis]